MSATTSVQVTEAIESIHHYMDERVGLLVNIGKLSIITACKHKREVSPEVSRHWCDLYFIVFPYSNCLNNLPLLTAVMATANS